MVESILKEIELRKDYLQHKTIETIYFGGGTPSLLSANEIEEILNKTQEFYQIAPGAEITLEANPEDLTQSYLKDLFSVGINRLSIGIQSFTEKNLPFLNRNHSLEQSKNSIYWAQNQGFKKLSLDYIFGIPGTNLKDVEQELQTVLSTEATHLSTYSLTIEPKTFFGRRAKKGLFTETPEKNMAEQFTFVMDYLQANGFQQYEISNFAKNGDISVHNSSYWKQEEYAGFGPSAHSFDGKSRQWNVSSNGKYLQLIQKGEPFFEYESLNPTDILNELIMTRLRTAWGLSLDEFQEKTKTLQLPFPEKIITDWIKEDFAFVSNQHLILTKKGKLIADKLSSDLFYI